MTMNMNRYTPRDHENAAIRMGLHADMPLHVAKDILTLIHGCLDDPGASTARQHGSPLVRPVISEPHIKPVNDLADTVLNWQHNPCFAPPAIGIAPSVDPSFPTSESMRPLGFDDDTEPDGRSPADHPGNGGGA